MEKEEVFSGNIIVKQGLSNLNDLYTLNQNLKCFQKSFRYNLDFF